MNAKTQIYFNLAQMYSFVCDALNIWDNEDPENKTFNYSINMCIMQIGEYANRIDKIQKDNELFLLTNDDVNFKNIRGIRNRIAHSYLNIDYLIIKDTMENDIPDLKNFLEKNIIIDVLDDPYILYENEYEEIINCDKGKEL